MNRVDIKARVVSALGERDDSATVALINSWIEEAVRTIESIAPISFLKSAKTATVTSGTSVYTFNQDGTAELIMEHPFYLTLQSITSPTAYTRLNIISEEQFDQFFSTPTTSGTPTRFMLEGGTNGVQFRIYPEPDANRTMKLDGYFYTDVSGWGDSSNNWLTVNEPNLLIEAVKTLAFEFYGQSDKADKARALYLAYLHGSPSDGVMGLVISERKKSWRGRHLRIKTFGDLPLSIEKNLRAFA